MSKKIEGTPLWTSGPNPSGSQEILKANDYPRDVKDRYDKENLNEGR